MWLELTRNVLVILGISLNIYILWKKKYKNQREKIGLILMLMLWVLWVPMIWIIAFW